jgi:hypothetical protein
MVHRVAGPVWQKRSSTIANQGCNFLPPTTNSTQYDRLALYSGYSDEDDAAAEEQIKSADSHWAAVTSGPPDSHNSSIEATLLRLTDGTGAALKELEEILGATEDEIVQYKPNPEKIAKKFQRPRDFRQSD